MKLHSNNTASRNAKPAFTLVEILVVIAIIIVLAGLAFVGTKQVTSSAEKSVSIENLRKLQLANGIYAAGNNGRFVATYTKDDNGKTGGLWDRNPDFLDILLGEEDPYNGRTQEKRVPPGHLDQVAYKARAKGYDTLKSSYGMISKIGYTTAPPNTDSSYLLSELTSPSETAAFVSAVNWLVQYSGRKGWNGVEGKVNAPRMAYRHKGKALVAYYDGHVGEVSEEDMARIDDRGGKKNIFWQGLNGQP